MSLLTQFGFNGHFNSLFIPYQKQGLTPGRVVSVKGFKYHLVTENGYIESELSGALLNSKEQWELPKVGDWVVAVLTDNLGYIVEVLERQNELSRKLPGKSDTKQVIAANVDYALLVQALDRDFNLMRLQRYLYQVYENGVLPVILLNKADLVTNPQEYIKKVKLLGFDVPVYLTSTVSESGLSELENQIMTPGKTYVLVGSSGVGKSSILNWLLKSEQQITKAISDTNNKGKHTTTFRYLSLLSNGALLIDTPGMREFGVVADETTDEFVHPMIEELAKNCRFPDCQHENDPGCAVVEAAREGLLPEIVYTSFLKLRKEQARFTMSVWQKKKKEKQAGKISREAQLRKRKWR